MKRILVPVDYSDPSIGVLQFAAGLAQKTGGSLTVLHVWECMPHAPPDLMVKGRDGRTRPLGEVIRENAERDMASFVEKAGLPPGLDVVTRIEPGDAAKTILGLLEAKKFDVIVMGTHGRGGVKHLMLGSVAEKIARGSPVPVITVPVRHAAP